MQLELGYDRELLVACLLLAENVTNSWIKHMWVSTQECGMMVSMDFAEVSTQWQGDLELMQLFVQTGWKQPALHALNQCQMFLKVFLLSDIVIGSGESIAAQF